MNSINDDVHEYQISREAWKKVVGSKGITAEQYHEMRRKEPDRWKELNESVAKAKRQGVKLAREIAKLPENRRKEYYNYVAKKSGADQAHSLAREVRRQIQMQQGMER